MANIDLRSKPARMAWHQLCAKPMRNRRDLLRRRCYTTVISNDGGGNLAGDPAVF